MIINNININKQCIENQINIHALHNLKQAYDFFNILAILIALSIFRNANASLICQIRNEKLKEVCIHIENIGTLNNKYKEIKLVN